MEKMKPKPFDPGKFESTGKKLEEIQEYLFRFQSELNSGGYFKIYRACIQATKKMSRLRQFIQEEHRRAHKECTN